MKRLVGLLCALVMLIGRMAKGRWGIGYIALPAFFVILIFSCAHLSYDFIGTWEYKPGTLTYVNHDQHVKLTFPNERWRVYTKPHKDLESLNFVWTRPTKDDRAYTILTALVPQIGIFMQVDIDPTAKHASMDEYVVLVKKILAGKISYSDVVKRDNRRIGVIIQQWQFQDGSFKMLIACFKEKARFTRLTLWCTEDLFELNEDEFWAIVDSYEYME